MTNVDNDSSNLFRLRHFSRQLTFNPLDLACFPIFDLEFFAFYTACVEQTRSDL